MDYFAPPSGEVGGAGLSQYEQRLLSSLVHTLRLGVYLDQRATSPDVTLAIDMTREGASDCVK